MLQKIRTKVAIVKFSGLANAGTERFLQAIAANLSKDKYEVTYFYCDSAPYVGSDWKHPDTDPSRKLYLEKSGINLVKFNVGAKDVTKPHHPWLDTNFWDLFKEKDFDILQTGRAGHAEYPFTQITNIPTVDIITLPNMAERKANVVKTIHISKWQAETWVSAGGDPATVEIIPIFSEMAPITKDSFRQELGIGDNDFVFGMHQREDDGIASPVPLQAYKRLEAENVHYVLMGGGPKYKEFAKQLELKNFHHLPHSGDDKTRDKFLATLNVFAHGRADGETFSLAIAEAMYHGLPIISHVAPAMGHKETIADGGRVVESIGDYTGELLRLMKDQDYYKTLSNNSKRGYQERLSLEANMAKIEKIYQDIMESEKVNQLDNDEFWDQMWNK